MVTILLTGATGFVGSHTLKALRALAKDHPELRLIAACRDSSRLWVDEGVEIRQGDLRDAAYRQRLLKGVDVLCHCAAWTSLWGYRKQEERLFLQPSLALIEAAKEAGVSRFVMVSTTSAAAPEHSADPQSNGQPRAYWPHLGAVIALEERLRELADGQFQVCNLRLGLFAGDDYGLGLLPILLPRLKTRLVPWVAAGKTQMPIISADDIGQAMALAATAKSLPNGYEGFNVVGPEVPTVREVIEYLYAAHGYPKPWFSVPFPVAFSFAALMEWLDPIVPWEPLVTRSIIHLLRDVHADNRKATQLLGYQPNVSWREAIDTQLLEMNRRAEPPMSMARPLP